MRRPEDDYFVCVCVNGDPVAFNFLVDKYEAGVYAFAYRKLHNFHDAEDLTQEVFLKAYRNLRSLERWDSSIIQSNLSNQEVAPC